MPGATFERLGIVVEPDGSDAEREGTINPASARTRDGALVLLPRVVAAGNVSRIARFAATWRGDDVAFVRDGFALEPLAPYERRAGPGGFGCEDPRVTFVPALDRYLMTYCAYGPDGARVAIAISTDARAWERLGCIDFHGMQGLGDKDAAFFPEIVTSPAGVPSFALLHRPTFHASTARGRGVAREILAMAPSDRESICMAYVPASAALRDVRALLDVAETRVAMVPDGAWGAIKVGAGTPPVRTASGWLVVYHGIDALEDVTAVDGPALRYRAGIALFDLETPHVLAYRSPEPVFWPQEPWELRGIVDDVVFPTAIDPRPDLGANVYDVYYGAGDDVIARGRLTVVP